MCQCICVYTSFVPLNPIQSIKIHILLLLLLLNRPYLVLHMYTIFWAKHVHFKLPIALMSIWLYFLCALHDTKQKTHTAKQKNRVKRPNKIERKKMRFINKKKKKTRQSFFFLLGFVILYTEILSNTSC